MPQFFLMRPAVQAAGRRLSLLAHGGVALLVAAPLLRPGSLLLLDFVYGPSVDIQWRASATTPGPVNTAPLQLLLWLLRYTGPLAAFLFVFLLVFGAGYLMNRAVAEIVPSAGPTARIVAGTLYAVNPFTYVRMVHGQLGLLAGMALLPLVAIAYGRLVARPSTGRAALLGLSIAVVGFASLHTLAMLFLVLPALAIVTRRPGLYVAVVAVTVAVAASSWWLIQTATQSFLTVGEEDLRVFATVPDGLTSAGHVSAMYGFWRVGEFALPRDGVWAWPITFAPIAALVLWGIVLWWRSKPVAAIALALLAVSAILLAAGTSFPPTAALFRSMFRNIPGFSLFREPQKWVVVLVFVYSLLAARAVHRLDDMTRRVVGSIAERGLFAIALLAVVTFYGRSMILNYSALRPVSFPTDWRTASNIINQRPARALAFPWHLYMTFPFTGRRIANPAGSYFDVPVVVSDAAEIGSIGSQSANPQSRLVERVLFEDAGHSLLSKTMAELCSRWVILFKAADWETYDWLRTTPQLRERFDGPTLRIFEAEDLRCTGRTRDQGT